MYVYFAGKLRKQAANFDQTDKDGKLQKRRDTNFQQVLMHALQHVGYNSDDDDLADLKETVFSVNKMRQTVVDTRLKSHLWNEMSISNNLSPTIHRVVGIFE